MEGLQSEKLPRAASWSTVPRPLWSDWLLGGQKQPGEPAGLVEKGQGFLVTEHMQADQ